MAYFNDVALRQEDVLGLEVTMQNVLPVQVLQSKCNLHASGHVYWKNIKGREDTETKVSLQLIIVMEGCAPGQTSP